MKCLVIGAGGFVGRHLVAAFRASGHDVMPLFGPDDPHDDSAGPSFRGDIRDRDFIDHAMQGAAWVIHAAGPPSVADSFADPQLFVETHVQGTALIAAAARAAGTERLLYVSSAEIYGQSDERVNEATPPHPLSPYGAAKLAAEWMVRTIYSDDDHRAIIVRPFALYGTGMRAESVLGRIIEAVRAGNPLALQTLTPVRDFLHVDDLTRLALHLIDHPAPPTIVNACSGIGISIGDLAVTALRSVGRSDLPISSETPPRPRDVRALVGDPSLANAIGWRPILSLDQGLSAMVSS